MDSKYKNILKYKEADIICNEPVHPQAIGQLLMAQEVYKILNK